MFVSREIISGCTWQAFERLIARLLLLRGFSGVRVVGGSGDKGADIIAQGPNRKRWLVQSKYWASPVREADLQKTLEALRSYKADNAVVVALNGIDAAAGAFQRSMVLQGKSLTVWTPNDLINMAIKLPHNVIQRPCQGDYQESAIQCIIEMIATGSPRRSMVVMATGLGKTFVAGEAIRRLASQKPLKILVIAHVNALILQLEKAFWGFIGPNEATVIWNQNEKPTDEMLKNCRYVFGSRDSISNYIDTGGSLPKFDLLLIDECHHAHSLSSSYMKIIRHLEAGTDTGPQLLGLTATPFLADPAARLEPIFGERPLVCIDMIYGLKHGFLSQVDYRLFTDNINWDGLRDLSGKNLSPATVNKKFFIKEWDDGVINQLQVAWNEIENPKAIVFCSTIEHAVAMAGKINARNFNKAVSVHSGNGKEETMTQFQKNLILSDFEDGTINVICTVDILNEGIDVPDVNIVVFNRITHSRRIFIQQLGRGLRISPEKKKTIVLDFAQDIRRYAAGLHLKRELAKPVSGTTFSLGNKIEFRNASGEDPRAESFLRAWLTDVEAIEAAGDDQGILRFPPALS